jgi:hypothetical protein
MKILPEIGVRQPFFSTQKAQLFEMAQKIVSQSI